MKIAAIQKTTFIDYPGKISCIIFTSWCNFRCHFCHNPEMVIPEEIARVSHDMIEEQSFLNFLDKRKGMLDAVVICWWEPTLQPDLYGFIKKIKNKWFLVKLDTNGRDFKMVERLISEWLIDYVAMDIKHPHEQYEKLVWVKLNTDFYTNYHATVQLLLEWKIDYEFRTTVMKPHHGLQEIEEIAVYIKWAKNYFIQNFVAGKMINPKFNANSLSQQELEDMKAIAEKYVQKCEIRD